MSEWTKEAAAALPDMSELTFDEKGHIYRLNGIVVPSVTTLMKPLSDDYYGSIDPDVLARAAAKGTAVHNAVENYIEFGVEDIAPMYAGYFSAFRKWWELRRPEPVATECRVYHKILRYAGTSDLLCVINGRLTLVDYKSTVQVNSKLCSIQLEGYDRAFESQGVKVEDRMILHIAKDGKFAEVPFQRNAKSWSVFSALLTVYNYMNE